MSDHEFQSADNSATSDIQTTSTFTIRRILMGIILFFALGVVGMTWLQISAGLAQKSQAQNAANANLTLGYIEDLAVQLSKERVVYAAALAGEAAPSPALLALVDPKKTAMIFAKLLKSKEALPAFDGRDKLIQDVRIAYGKYSAQAANLDGQLSLNKATRNVTVRAATTVRADLIETLNLLRSAMENNIDPGSVRASLALRLRRSLWDVYDFGIKDSEIFARTIGGGTPIRLTDMTLLGEYGGRIRGSWDNAAALLDSSIFDRDVKAIRESLEVNFLDEFNYNKDDVYEASEEGLAYDIAAEEWVQTSFTAKEDILTLLAVVADYAQAESTKIVGEAQDLLTVSFILIAFAVFLSLFAIYMVNVRVAGSINGMKETMEVLATGNLDVEIPDIKRRDEIGSMARSVQVFQQNAVRSKQMEEETRRAEEETRLREQREEEERAKASEERRLAREQQAEEARKQRRKEMLELADKFEMSVTAVVEAVSASAKEMEGAARGLTQTAEETQTNSEVVAQAAETASQNAQMVASAAEELSSSVREITGQTTQSSAAARDAVGRTESASDDISALADAAQKIGDVVQLINDIAEQTNLLALNATIEAARAGDAGKGFAVVASEVKSLANQTASATQEISSQVEGMQSATHTAVQAIQNIRGIITNIESTAVSIASSVEEQDASTQEIARNVSEVSSGTEEVTNNIQNVNRGATETGGAANEVLSAALRLSEQSDAMRRQVQDFLATIRNSD